MLGWPLHYEELHAVLLTMYNAGDQTRRNEMRRACVTQGYKTGAYRVLAGNLR